MFSGQHRPPRDDGCFWACTSCKKPFGAVKKGAALLPGVVTTFLCPWTLKWLQLQPHRLWWWHRPQGHGHQLTLTLGYVRAIDQLTGLSESVDHRPHHGLMATHASHIGMVPEAAKPEDITETSGSSPDCICQASGGQGRPHGPSTQHVLWWLCQTLTFLQGSPIQKVSLSSSQQASHNSQSQGNQSCTQWVSGSPAESASP